MATGVGEATGVRDAVGDGFGTVPFPGSGVGVGVAVGRGVGDGVGVGVGRGVGEGVGVGVGFGDGVGVGVGIGVGRGVGVGVGVGGGGDVGFGPTTIARGTDTNEPPSQPATAPRLRGPRERPCGSRLDLDLEHRDVAAGKHVVILLRTVFGDPRRPASAALPRLPVLPGRNGDQLHFLELEGSRDRDLDAAYRRVQQDPEIGHRELDGHVLVREDDGW